MGKYTDIIGEIAAEDSSLQKQGLQSSMFVASKGNPDKTAESMKLAESSGLPVDVVARNPEVVKQKVSSSTYDIESLVNENPGLNKWLIENTKNSELSIDDLGVLGAHEKKIKEYGIMQSLGRSFNAGLAGTNAAIARAPALAYQVFAYPTNAYLEVTGQKERQVKAPEWLLNNPAAKMYDAAQEAYTVPELSKDVLDMAWKGDFSGAGRSLLMQLAANAPQQILILGSAFTGAPMAGLGLAGVSQASSANKTAQESGVTPFAATTNALAQGSLEMLLEQAGTFGIFKKWESAIAKSVGKDSAKKVIGEFGKTFAYSMFAEGNEEFWTSVGQDFTDYVTGVNPEALKGIVQRAMNAGLIGAASGGAMTAPAAIGSGVNRGRIMRDVEQTKQFYLSLGQSAEASKLRERMPEKHRELMERLTKDTPIENVYIPIEDYDMYMQEKNIDPSTAANELGIIKEYDLAKETGKDIQIPLATFANKVVGTEHYQGMADNIKFDPNSFTVNQAKKQEAEMQAELEKAAQEAQKEADKEIMTPGAKEILDAQTAEVQRLVAEQLKATNKFSDKDIKNLASLWSNYARVFGGKQGIMPLEFYKQNALNVTAEDSLQQPAATDTTQLNQSAPAPTFYSQAEKVIAEKMPNAASPEMIRGILSDKNGVKSEELKWIGIDEFLAGKHKVTKQELSNFINQNQVLIKEIEKGGAGDIQTYEQLPEEMKSLVDLVDNGELAESTFKLEAERLGYEVSFNMDGDLESIVKKGTEATKFQQYQIPNGSNYRELLLTLPTKPRKQTFEEFKIAHKERFPESSVDEKNLREAYDAGRTIPPKGKNTSQDENVGFRSSHFEEPNILAHIRMNDRVDADGKKVLFIEEVQSDWHQKGRSEGYSSNDKDKILDYMMNKYPSLPKDTDSWSSNILSNNNVTQDDANNWYNNFIGNRASSVPDAPFKKTWHELAMKRMLRYAAENNYDRIAWTTGEQQAERYDLSKQVEKIGWMLKDSSGGKRVEIYPNGSSAIPIDIDKDAKVVSSGQFLDKNLDEVVGKDIAKRIMDENVGLLDKANLKVGGEGMKGFYDQMLPSFMNKYAKKWGGRVGTTLISGGDKFVRTNDITRIIKANDNLGFDSVNEATQAIMTNDDFAKRWDLPEEDAKVINEWKTKQSSQEVHSIDITPDMRQSVLKGQPLFQGNDNPLGAIIFGKEGSFDMRLLKDMNYSTFLHETGHAFLEMMRRAAVDPNVSPEIKDMSDKTLKWLGIESWDKLGRKQHEQFAQGFEKYLFEGKAPSEGLREAFNRFRIWLVSVYKTLQGLNVELSDDIRDVMDRMLASDEEIARVRAKQTVQMILDPIAVMGPEKAKKYTETLAQVKADAEEEMRIKLLTEYQRERKSWWMDELKKIRKQVIQEVNARPEQIAVSVLQRGKMPDGTELPAEMQGLKISTKDLIKYYSNKYDVDVIATDMNYLEAEFLVEQLEETLRQIDQFRNDVGKMQKYDNDYLAEELSKIPKRYLTKNKFASKPDLVASNLGFESDQALIDSIIENEQAYENASKDLISARKELRALKKLVNIEKYNSIKESMRALPRGMTSKEGMATEMVAQLFGYSSAEQFLDVMSRIRKRHELVKEISHEMMVQQYGELYGDQEAMNDEAMRAIDNEKKEAVIRMEMDVLADNYKPALKSGIRTLSARIPSSQVAKKYAAEILGRTVLNKISPYQFQLAQQREAKAAGVKFTQGKFEEAFEHKRKELINYELARAATAARDNIKDSFEIFKKISKSDEKISKSRDVDYVNAARAILALHGIIEADEDPYKFLKSTEAYDQETYQVLVSLVDAATENAGDYKNLTYDDFLKMKDAVDAIWEIAKRSRQIQINGEKVELEEVLKNLVERMISLNKSEKEKYTKIANENDKFIRGFMGAVAQGRRVESWADLMDGGDSKGWFTQAIFNPVAEGTQNFRIQNKEYTQKFLELIQPMEKAFNKKEIVSDELGHIFQSKSELLGALLHTGNESNLSKLLRGRGWGTFLEDGSLDTSRWDSFIRRMQETGILTKQDYDFIQSVWDLFDELKPAAQKAHKEMYGFYFNSVTENEIVTPFGKYRGGYAPAIVDIFSSEDAAIRQEKENSESLNNSFMFPTTGRGFTKGRVEAYAAPLALDLRLVPQHINKVLRFTNIEPRVKDVGRIIRNKTFREYLRDIDPVAGQIMLSPWLQRSAQQIVETPDKTWAGWRVWRELRTRSGVNIMAGNVINTLQQFTGLSIASTKVKPKYLAKALWNYINNPSKVAKFVTDNDPFMRTRSTTQVMEIQKNIEDLMMNQNKYSKAIDFAKQHAYFMQQGTQNVVDMIVWPAAYDQSVAEGNGKDSHDQAVKDAAAAVRLTQGDFSPENISNFESGNSFARAFLMFYSYFNMQANLLGTEFAKVSRELGLKRGAGKMFYIYLLGFMIPAVVSEFILKSLSGEDWDKDDDGYLDDILSMFFGSQFRTATAMIPFAGQAINVVVNKFNNKWYDDDIRSSPAVSMVESAASAPQSVYKAIVEEGNKKTAIRDTLSLIGLLTGAPVSVLSKPAGYIADVNAGNVYPENTLDFTRGLITGKSAQ